MEIFYLYKIFQFDQNVRNLKRLLPSARFGPNGIFFNVALTEFTNKSMQHIMILFSRSTIQHRNARTDPAWPKTTTKIHRHSIFSRTPAGGSESPARAGGGRGGAESVDGHYHESI
jgi:hypothetical protein